MPLPKRPKDDRPGLRKLMRESANKPRLYGEAFCAHCGHEFWPLKDAGTVELQCPKCGRMTGLYKYPCTAESVIHCGNCGCHIYTLSDTGAICYKCGKKADYMKESSKI